MNTYQLPRTTAFEGTYKGKNTHLMTLTNRAGMQIALTDYGARLVSAMVPDKHGDLIDVVLGFDSIQKYMQADEQYHGATIGRYGNRIANGEFTLDGKKYTLAKNNGPNCLHGGLDSFDKKVWDRQVSFQKSVTFYYVSPAGEEGFPGELKTVVSYELTNDNEIIIQFQATTNAPTILNLTNHAYFNLNGEGNGDILNHDITINATEFVEINQDQVATGSILPVQGNSLDFTRPRELSKCINSTDDQILFAQGYDHTFINKQPISQSAAKAYSKQSGIQLDVFTSEPGLHLYTGNFLPGDQGKSGRNYRKHGGFCFEAQHYPDSPNHAHFPSVTLLPGEVFKSTIKYKFSIRKDA